MPSNLQSRLSQTWEDDNGFSNIRATFMGPGLTVYIIPSFGEFGDRASIGKNDAATIYKCCVEISIERSLTIVKILRNINKFCQMQLPILFKLFRISETLIVYQNNYGIYFAISLFIIRNKNSAGRY